MHEAVSSPLNHAPSPCDTTTIAHTTSDTTPTTIAAKQYNKCSDAASNRQSVCVVDDLSLAKTQVHPQLHKHPCVCALQHCSHPKLAHQPSHANYTGVCQAGRWCWLMIDRIGKRANTTCQPATTKPAIRQTTFRFQCSASAAWRAFV